jgi:hypothetical protein
MQDGRASSILYGEMTHHVGTKDTKGSKNYYSELRALCIFRGEHLFYSKLAIPKLFRMIKI